MRSFSPVDASTGQLLPPLQEIFTLLGKPATNLNQAVKISQAWVSSNYVDATGRRLERFDLNLQLSLADRQLFDTLTDQLKLTTEWTPNKNHYRYAILPGGYTLTMRHLLAETVRLHQAGIRFDAIALLGADRPLDPVRDTASLLTSSEPWALPLRPGWQAPDSLGDTETDICRLILQQVELPLDMPMPTIIAAIGQSGRRATTADQVEQWAETINEPGSTLVITRQPGCHFQDMTIRRCLPAAFELDTCGFAGESWQREPAIVLGQLARWLWEWQRAGEPKKSD